jgi:hypothetical protein
VQQKLDPIIASPDAKTAYAQVRDALPAAVQQKLDTTFPSADPKTVVSPTKDSMSIVVSQKIDVKPKLADSLAINTQPISVESLNKVSASQASDAVKGTKIAELRSEPLAQNIVIALPASFSAATRIGSDNYFSKLTPAFDKTQLPTDRNIVGFSATKISAVPVTANSAEFLLTNQFVSKLPPYKQQQIDYFLQTPLGAAKLGSEAGRSEIFAEMFAILQGGGGAESMQQTLNDNFPNVRRVMQEKLAQYN